MIPFEHVGIAMGSSIAAWYNTWLLGRKAKMYGDFKVTKETKLFTAQIFISCAFMLVFILLVNHYYGYLFYSDHYTTKLPALFGTIILAIAIFLILSFLQKLHKPLLKKYENRI
jgi:putative peptidoglycan lipid II flippase